MRVGICVAALCAIGVLGCEDGSVLPIGGDVPVSVPDGGSSESDGILSGDLGVPEVSPVDVTPEEVTPDDCPPGSGCFGEPCDTAADCLSGVCTLHLGDQVCSKTCDEDCPAGWQCSLVTLGGADPVQVCVSQAGLLCRPCATHDDCASDQGEAPCISYGEDGSFCGASCDEDNPCPEGYACQESTTVDGGESVQCVAESGQCACSETSTNLALSTPCSVTNEWGSCQGLRRCAPDGLEACDAAEPSEEICNGIDDDCDGEIDETSCDDGNPCTEDLCAGEAGCQYEDLDGVACEDEDACTETDTCAQGVCLGTTVTCDDENPCTLDGCLPESGCTFEAATLPCDDGDPCTLSDLCEDGACTPGTTIDCDDQNPCTEDACNGVSGCDHIPNELPCDDQNACTVGDQCQGGVCKATASLACDDQNPCTTDSCDLEGGCAYDFNALPCDDEDACTVGDQCQGGTCAAGESVDCDDENDCTSDSCHWALGCQHLPNANDCDDQNPCTVDDHCAAGVCLATEPLDCADDNPCTNDFCVPSAGCAHVPNAAPCDDGDVCTLGDTCAGNTCQSSGATLVCDDQNPCTDDTCDPELGCLFVPNTSPCDDGNDCTTGDSCIQGQCLGDGLLTCDDQNPCTHDSCLIDGGCLHEPKDGPCSDGDPCTVEDQCVDATCVSGTVKSCDDQNPCTDDSCEALGDCAHVPNQAECDDGNPCTLGDHCSEGGCAIEVMLLCDDDNPCTLDYCDPNLGCQTVPTVGPCSDGDLCTLGDTCVEGACVGSEALSCEDDNPCTFVGCEPEIGCTYEDSDLPCDDEDACTVLDICSQGACVGQGALDCDDDNLCTADLCDPIEGCEHDPINLVCDDQDACTVGDQCEDGACVSGPVDPCDDQNPCTTDSCDPTDGCKHVANTESCDDGDPCTQGDACQEGVCVAGVEPDCDDGNPCTEDLCDGTGVCAHPNAANGIACGDDGTCQDGTCDEGGCDGTTMANFEYTGGMQTLQLPELACLGTSGVTIEVWGAQGGGDDSGTCSTLGGLGGYAKGTLSVSSGDTLYIFVGGDGMSGGYNGGGGSAGSYTGSVGGGASDVRHLNFDLDSRAIVAGGGGASAAYSLGCGGWNGAAGGDGGGPTGQTGQISDGNPPAAGGGEGGSQASGGASGNDTNPIANSTPGTFGQGGLGGHGVDPGNQACGAAGGGGGGYYGGGGGGSNNCGGGGGGGGSNYTGGVSELANDQGVRTGHGRVVISY